MRSFCAVSAGRDVRELDGSDSDTSVRSKPIYLLVLLCIILRCVNPIFSVEHSDDKYSDYCVLWSEPDKVIVASGYRLYMTHVTNNQSSLFPLLEWPVDSVASVPTTAVRSTRCSAAIKWVARLLENAYEVCGSIGDEIQCHVYKVQDNVWTWISTRKTVFIANFHSLVHNFVDGYSLLAYSPLNGDKSIVQLRSTQSPILSSRSTNQSELPLQKINWWNTVLETSNHNQMQLAFSHKVRFHHVISAPGRRYLIFQEPGLESYSQQALWTQQTDDVIYTRVARVCTGDPGLRSPRDGRLLFTSFFKARLICRIRANDPKHLLRFNHANSGYNYQATEIHFNYPITFTQSFITGLYSEPVIYGLFSLVDPELVDQMPTELLRGMRTFEPLALCLYRLADIDKVVHSSDLVQLIPPQTRPINFAQPTDNMSYNVSGTAIYTSSIPIDRRVSRIRRIHSDHLETITDCPGPSLNNRRLALEAPLLANPVLPHTGRAMGLIHPREPITALVVDPRSFENSPAMQSKAGHPDSHTFQVMYIATRSGEVFKLLLLVPDLRHTKPNAFGSHSTHAPNADRSVLVSGNIHMIQKLFQLPQPRPILSIHFVQRNSSGDFINVPSPLGGQLDFGTYLDLYFISDSNTIRLPVENCSQAVTCVQCVALRDPDCLWNLSSGTCTTGAQGIQNVWTGRNPECEKLDPPTFVENKPTRSPQTMPLVETKKKNNHTSNWMAITASNNRNNAAKVVQHFTNPTDSTVAFTIKFDQWLLLWLSCFTLLPMCVLLTWLITRFYYNRKFRLTARKRNQNSFTFSRPESIDRQLPNHLCATFHEEIDGIPTTDPSNKSVNGLCSCDVLSDLASLQTGDDGTTPKATLFSPGSATVRSFLPHRLLYHELELNTKPNPNRFHCKSEKPTSRLGTLCLNNDLRLEQDTSFPDSPCEQCTETVELHSPG
ncbi:hypothetical protein D915_001352 [Fasciola hepatica]|uniref:Sema domain-containing protein n=1 Tax=Fasciola hepatica TaxID=6192 RepID=A0A4E0RJB6_FASHE|nr:hypothetical protein D915_001352 [Fasciola hepatica]